MNEWFRGLERREQWVLVGGVLVLALALFLLLVVRPLYAGTAKLAQRVDDKQQLVVWMRTVAPELRAAGPASGSSARSGDSLVLIVADTAAASDLRQYLKQNQPAGENTIRVRFEAAPFDQLVQWLGALQVQHGVRIDSASFDGGVQPGVVTASVVLARPAA